MKEVTFTVPLKLVQSAEANANPMTTWMEFVLADDKPNANLQGVPSTTFARLISTGQYMPLKMSEGKIDGHEGSKPLGVIRDMRTDADRVVGNAVVWNKERPSDVALLRESYSNGEAIDISFELMYTEFEIDDSGIEWILDPTVRAATIVRNPAYEGRTPVLTIASDKMHVDLPDASFAFIESGGVTKNGVTHPRSLRHFPYRDVEGKISEILLNESLAEIESETFDQKEKVLTVLRLAAAELTEERIDSMADETKILELEQEASTLRDKIQELEDAVKTLTEERDGLHSYKENREKEDANATLLQKRLDVLIEAGFEFSEEQIEKKQVLWLALDDDAFALYVADLQTVQAAEASKHKGSGVPDTSGPNAAKNGVAVLTEYFKEDK